MHKSILKFNVFNGDFQPVEVDDNLILNPFQPFIYRWYYGLFFLVPNYLQEIGNA